VAALVVAAPVVAGGASVTVSRSSRGGSHRERSHASG
jgi:hypothetical protein